jgi:hypothetical protein
MVEQQSPKLLTRVRFLAGLYALIAQMVEHAAVNRGVVGSSPTEGACNGYSHTYFW